MAVEPLAGGLLVSRGHRQCEVMQRRGRCFRSGALRVAVAVKQCQHGRVAGDAAAHDSEVSAVREAARLIAEDERLTPVLIPLGDGLLAAARD